MSARSTGCPWSKAFTTRPNCTAMWPSSFSLALSPRARHCFMAAVYCCLRSRSTSRSTAWLGSAEGCCSLAGRLCTAWGGGAPDVGVVWVGPDAAMVGASGLSSSFCFFERSSTMLADKAARSSSVRLNSSKAGLSRSISPGGREEEEEGVGVVRGLGLGGEVWFVAGKERAATQARVTAQDAREPGLTCTTALPARGCKRLALQGRHARQTHSPGGRSRTCPRLGLWRTGGGWSSGCGCGWSSGLGGRCGCGWGCIASPIIYHGGCKGCHIFFCEVEFIKLRSIQVYEVARGKRRVWLCGRGLHVLVCAQAMH